MGGVGPNSHQVVEVCLVAMVAFEDDGPKLGYTAHSSPMSNSSCLNSFYAKAQRIGLR